MNEELLSLKKEIIATARKLDSMKPCTPRSGSVAMKLDTLECSARRLLVESGMEWKSADRLVWEWTDEGYRKE